MHKLRMSYTIRKFITGIQENNIKGVNEHQHNIQHHKKQCPAEFFKFLRKLSGISKLQRKRAFPLVELINALLPQKSVYNKESTKREQKPHSAYEVKVYFFGIFFE